MITWSINNRCNFNCIYCPLRHDNQPPLDSINLSILSEGLDFLQGSWLIYISGGEPFLERNIINICQVITQRNYLSVNTNLSTENIFDFANKIDPEKTLNITASVHIGEREKRDLKLNSFINKILHLQNKGFNIIASYVVHPTLLGRVKQDIEFLTSSGIQKVRIKIFRGIYNERYYPYAFNFEQRDFLKSMEAEYPEFEILLKTHNYYGQLCRAGQNSLIMDRTGNLTRCTNTYRNYGNLFKKTMVRDMVARPCPINKCGCPYEGIRNVLPTKGSIDSLLIEDISQKYLKSKKIVGSIIENPKKLLKIKDKVIEYFAQPHV